MIAARGQAFPIRGKFIRLEKGGDDVPDACGKFAVAPERRTIAKTIWALRPGRDPTATHSGDRACPGGLYHWLTSARCLHPTHISRPATALGRDPDNVLAWVFDVAGFAMYAILRIDLQARALGG